jgi:hypothetical protein
VVFSPRLGSSMMAGRSVGACGGCMSWAGMGYRSGCGMLSEIAGRSVLHADINGGGQRFETEILTLYHFGIGSMEGDVTSFT